MYMILVLASLVLSAFADSTGYHACDSGATNPNHGTLLKNAGTFTLTVKDSLGNVVTTVTPGNAYTVTLSGGSFKGWTCAAFSGTAPTGFTSAKFGTLSAATGYTTYVQTMKSCAGGVTQTNNNLLTSVVFNWVVPTTNPPTAVTLWAVVVTSKNTNNYWVKQAITVNAAVAASASSTPSAAAVGTSATGTPTPSTSTQVAASATATRSGSVPASPTRTQSVAPTPSSTPSFGSSPSATSSISPSVSRTPSITRSPTRTAWPTRSPSMTPSIFLSISSTKTPSKTPTGSITPTASASSTPSASPFVPFSAANDLVTMAPIGKVQMGPITMWWKMNHSADAVDVVLHSTVIAWYGIAFSKTHRMIGGEAVIVVPDADTPRIKEAPLAGKTMLGISTTDCSQGLRLVQSSCNIQVYPDGSSVAKFSWRRAPLAPSPAPMRRLEAQAHVPRSDWLIGNALSTDEVVVTWAFGSSMRLSYHPAGAAGAVGLDLLTGEFWNPQPAYKMSLVLHVAANIMAFFILVPASIACARYCRRIQPTTGSSTAWFFRHWLMAALAAAAALVGAGSGVGLSIYSDPYTYKTVFHIAAGSASTFLLLLVFLLSRRCARPVSVDKALHLTDELPRYPRVKPGNWPVWHRVGGALILVLAVVAFGSGVVNAHKMSAIPRWVGVAVLPAVVLFVVVMELIKRRRVPEAQPAKTVKAELATAVASNPVITPAACTPVAIDPKLTAPGRGSVMNSAGNEQPGVSESTQ